jgi:hypothetical protein
MFPKYSIHFTDVYICYGRCEDVPHKYLSKIEINKLNDWKDLYLWRLIKKGESYTICTTLDLKLLRGERWLTDKEVEDLKVHLL